MGERILKIIQAGIRAPSGDNCQPWRFEVEGDRIDLFNLPERDTSLYNYKQRASLVAHGACIENMSIAASNFGFKAGITYFPIPEDQDHVARLKLVNGEITGDPLFSFVSERTINRKRYKPENLSPEAMDCIRQTTLNSDIQGCSFRLLLGSEKETAAEIVALNDRLVFENAYLHRFLFEHIRWTLAEAERTKDGLDIRTLELAPQDRMIFPLLKSFCLVSLIGMFGATKMIAANAKNLLLSASSAGIITIQDTSCESWINAGRLLERAWLEATRQHLSFHLMTGMTLMVQRVRDGVVDGLTGRNISLIKRAELLLREVAGLESEVALLFRVGKAEPPSATSFRRDYDDCTNRY